LVTSLLYRRPEYSAALHFFDRPGKTPVGFLTAPVPDPASPGPDRCVQQSIASQREPPYSPPPDRPDAGGPGGRDDGARGVRGLPRPLPAGRPRRRRPEPRGAGGAPAAFPGGGAGARGPHRPGLPRRPEPRPGGGLAGVRVQPADGVPRQRDRRDAGAAPHRGLGGRAAWPPPGPAGHR